MGWYASHAWGPLQSVTGLMGDSYAFTYDSNGRHKSTTYPGNVTIDRSRAPPNEPLRE